MEQPVTTTTPRIYIASLSDYNAGRLHGAWFDVTDYADGEELYEAFKEQVLDTSTEPIAEEWAIHDYDGFGAMNLGEYESFDTLIELGNAIEEKGPALLGWLEHHDDPSNADLSDFDDQFRGEWDSERHYVWEEVCELGWGGLTGEQIDEFSFYVDIEAIEREMFYHGPYFSVKTPDYKVWVFREDW